MGLLSNYLPNMLPEDPNQNQAARQGLLQFGAALLGGKGNFGSILGQGLAAGSGGYNSTLQALQQKALIDAQTKHMGLINQEAEQKIAEPGQIAAILGSPSAAPAAPSSPSSLVSGQSAPLSSLPQMSPASDAKPLSMIPQASMAPPAAPAPQPQQATQADRADLFTQYTAIGDKLTAAGKVGAAKQYYELAVKFKPEVEKTETLLDPKTQQPVSVITFKDGSRKVSEFGAMPDYKVVNNGKTNDLVDMNTGKKGPGFAIGVSPDTEYSRQTQYGVQGMIDRRSKDEAKTQVVQTDEGPVLVDKGTATGRAITGPNGERLAGVSKPLNDSQSKALLFGTRMQESDKILKQLDSEGTITSVPGARTPILGGIVNALSGDGQQMLDQAKRDFVNAVLRRESGAAISPGEFESAERQYFPQIGEGPKVREQKSRNRALAIKGMLVEVPEKQRASITPVAALPKKPAGLPSGWSVKEQ